MPERQASSPADQAPGNQHSRRFPVPDEPVGDEDDAEDQRQGGGHQYRLRQHGGVIEHSEQGRASGAERHQAGRATLRDHGERQQQRSDRYQQPRQ